MGSSVFTLFNLTIAMAMLVAVLAIAVLRFMAVARASRRQARRRGGASPDLSAVLQDTVTELRAQERALVLRVTTSEQLSTRIVDSLTAGLLVVGRDGSVELMNAAAARLLGLRAEWKGRPYRDLLEVAPPLRDAIDEGLATAQPIVRRELRLPHPLPASYLGVTVSPIGEPGEPRGVICLFSDLSAVIDLEQQLRLKEALARVGEMAAGLAHEFRNGLATIHGYARLLDPQALPERYRPYVEGIREETDLLGQMVTNFLGFARPEQVTLQPVPLERVVRRVAGDLQRELGEGGRVEVEGGWGTVDADEGLLRQMFVNLVRNAAEACQGSGTRPDIVLRGGIDHRKGVCRVAVDDNGPGIPEDARERVFQPFFTTRSRGTGLGLAIVQKTAVLHNGRVAAGESPAGGGRIQVTLPLSAGASDAGHGD
jgi:signal transduction histidine kinase